MPNKAQSKSVVGVSLLLACALALCPTGEGARAQPILDPNAVEPGSSDAGASGGSAPGPGGCPEQMQEIAASRGGIEACGTGRPPAYAFNPLDGIWDIASPGNPKVAAMTVFMHSHYGILHREDPNKPSPALAVARLQGEQGYRQTGAAIVLSSEDDGSVTTSYGQFGFSGRVRVYWSVQPTADPDVLVGEWEYDEQKGQSIWRRRAVNGAVQGVRITAAYANPAGEWVDDAFAYGTRPGRLARDVSALSQGCSAGLNGACDLLRIDVLGGNFAGAHDVWIDPATLFELESGRWICVGGATEALWYNCGIGATPGDSVAGIQLDIRLRGGIRSGPVSLWVDGQPIPIAVEIDGGVPDAPARPNLVMLDAVNAAGAQITETEEGKPFQVKAIYDGPHPDTWVSVDVPVLAVVPETGSDRLSELVLYRSDDPKVFESGWLAVVDDESAP